MHRLEKTRNLTTEQTAGAGAWSDREAIEKLATEQIGGATAAEQIGGATVAEQTAGAGAWSDREAIEKLLNGDWAPQELVHQCYQCTAAEQATKMSKMFQAVLPLVKCLDLEFISDCEKVLGLPTRPEDEDSEDLLTTLLARTAAIRASRDLLFASRHGQEAEAELNRKTEAKAGVVASPTSPLSSPPGPNSTFASTPMMTWSAAASTQHSSSSTAAS